MRPFLFLIFLVLISAGIFGAAAPFGASRRGTSVPAAADAAEIQGGVSKPTLWIIPHTHWEGAVFKTREEYLQIGLPHILQALDLLQNYPDYRFVLDQVAYVRPFLERYPAMTTQGCWYYAYAAAAEVGSLPAVRPGWQQIAELQRYNEDNRSATRPIKGPLLILAGDDDQSVNFANIKSGVTRACKLGLPIEFVHRPGLDHDPLMEKTIELQLAWTRDRLAGKPWHATGCAAALAAK